MNWTHRDEEVLGIGLRGRVKGMGEVRVAQGACLAGWEVAPCGHLGQNSGVRS